MTEWALLLGTTNSWLSFTARESDLPMKYPYWSVMNGKEKHPDQSQLASQKQGPYSAGTNPNRRTRGGTDGCPVLP